MEVVLSYITTDFHILVAVQDLIIFIIKKKDLIVFKSDWKNRNWRQWRKQGRGGEGRGDTFSHSSLFTHQKILWENPLWAAKGNRCQCCRHPSLNLAAPRSPSLSVPPHFLDHRRRPCRHRGVDWPTSWRFNKDPTLAALRLPLLLLWMWLVCYTFITDWDCAYMHLIEISCRDRGIVISLEFFA